MHPPALLKTVTLAVLAGGAGSRMGRAKALLEVNGKPILEHLLDRLQWPGPTLLVTSPGCERPPGAGRFDVEATDDVPGEGPLRGVLTALEHTATDTLVVIAVDMPALRRDDLAWYAERLAELPDLLGVMASNREARIEPLPCALRTRVREIVSSRLAASRGSLHGLAEDPRVRVLDGSGLPPSAWLNANTPEEWERIVRSLSVPQSLRR